MIGREVSRLQENITRTFMGVSREGFLFAGRSNTMPFKPRRPCSHPGCPKLTDGRFCAEHAKEEAKRYERYQRDPATRKLYGRTWKRIRACYILAHPLCEMCEAEGKLTSAKHVHHKVELRAGGTHSDDNLCSLCAAHHSALHLRRRSNSSGN